MEMVVGIELKFFWMRNVVGPITEISTTIPTQEIDVNGDINISDTSGRPYV